MSARLASVLVVLLAWWAVGQGLGATISVPGPERVVAAFWDLAASGRLGNALALSLGALALGGGLSVLIGIPLGLWMGVRRWVEQSLDFYVSALYVMPMSAIVPLLVFWFGIALSARVIFILIFTVPQIVITCFQGARHTPPRLVEVARAFRATDRDIFWKVVMPHTVPFVVTALRLGVGRAIQGMVVAELLIAGTQGLGFLIEVNSASLNLAAVLAVVLFLMLLGIAVTAAVHRVEGAIAPWRKGLTIE